jgi:hypothetical protein
MVAAMFVLACKEVQVPVNVELEGTGAKHDLPFWVSTADAKAPDESNWRICRPGPAPRHCDNFNWKPVIATDCWNKKSWYNIDGSVRRGQFSVHVWLFLVEGST